MRAKLIRKKFHFYILPGEKELIGETTYWKINPTEAQRLVGITMGNLPANEMTQFISAPTIVRRKLHLNRNIMGALLQSPQNQVRRAVVSDKIRG